MFDGDSSFHGYAWMMCSKISMQSYITWSLLTLPIDSHGSHCHQRPKSCYNLRVRTVANVEVNARMETPAFIDLLR